MREVVSSCPAVPAPASHLALTVDPELCRGLCLEPLWLSSYNSHGHPGISMVGLPHVADAEMRLGKVKRFKVLW